MPRSHDGNKHSKKTIAGTLNYVKKFTKMLAFTLLPFNIEIFEILDKSRHNKNYLKPPVYFSL